MTGADMERPLAGGTGLALGAERVRLDVEALVGETLRLLPPLRFTLQVLEALAEVEHARHSLEPDDLTVGERPHEVVEACDTRQSRLAVVDARLLVLLHAREPASLALGAGTGFAAAGTALGVEGDGDGLLLGLAGTHLGLDVVADGFLAG